MTTLTPEGLLKFLRSGLWLGEHQVTETGEKFKECVGMPQWCDVPNVG